MQCHAFRTRWSIVFVLAAAAAMFERVPPVEAGHIYWTVRGGNAVKRADLDGSNIQVVIPPPLGGGDPGGIGVDPQAGKIYWTSDQGVQRANLDGSNIEPVLAGPSSFFTRFVLDAANRQMFWTYGYDIWRANTDGSDMTKIVPYAALNFGGFTVHSDKLYWIDLLDGRVFCAKADGTDVQLLLSGAGGGGGIDVDAANNKLYWNFSSRIRRANLDGTNAEDAFTVGVFSPQFLAVSTGEGKLYWQDAGPRFVRANLDGTELQTIVEGENASAMALDEACVPSAPDDFDGDGIPDNCDADIDNDGVLNSADACPFTPLGLAVGSDGRPKADMNSDCLVDGLDVQMFVSQVLNQP
jgi:hypothetical protein